VTKDVKGKTMSELFQEAFSATTLVNALPKRSTGYSKPDNYLPINHSNISGFPLILFAYFSVERSELAIMEGCNRLCRWRKIGTLSSQGTRLFRWSLVCHCDNYSSLTIATFAVKELLVELRNGYEVRTP
jgi:hypothetical protein